MTRWDTVQSRASSNPLPSLPPASPDLMPSEPRPDSAPIRPGRQSSSPPHRGPSRCAAAARRRASAHLPIPRPDCAADWPMRMADRGCAGRSPTIIAIPCRPRFANPSLHEKIAGAAAGSRHSPHLPEGRGRTLQARRSRDRPNRQHPPPGATDLVKIGRCRRARDRRPAPSRGSGARLVVLFETRDNGVHPG